MKELSIEEKAKRYDEAIEKFDVILNLNTVKESGTIFADDVIKILPELKESEDERIRKALIKIVNGIYQDEVDYAFVEDGISYEQLFSWLEKQGEQKPVDFSDLRTWKYIVDTVWTEKEGIGQYLDSPFTEEVAKKLQKRFGHIEQSKPEWSEEDEKRRKKIMHILSLDGRINNEELSSINDWLKSLKERYCPQKQWKPTEEQMNALGFVIECSKLPSGSFKYKSVLRGLKAQLSALCSDLE